jgi:predicted lactoylglutathione lyase
VLLRKSIREPEKEKQHIVGRVTIDDEGQLPLARKELIKRSFEAAGRPIDDDYVYDFMYNQELNQFELVVYIDVDG